LKLTLAASVLLAGYLGWRSRGWPLIHDAPLFHYVGWLMGQGLVPYRDIFDMNLPGVYLLHWAVLAVAGAGDFAWRVFDLAWLAATAVALFAFCLPLGGRVGAAAAAVLFTLYHLAGGAWRAGQRDFLLCLFLAAGAVGIARAWDRPGGLWPLALGGAALAAGFTLKPYAPGLFWLGGLAAGALVARRAGRVAVAGAGAVLAGGGAVLALVFGWLAWRGGLGVFVEEYMGYVLPFYGGLGREPLWQAIGGHTYAWPLVALLAALVAWGLCVPARAAFGIRRPLAVLGLVAAALHFALQGKGWEYHLYPLVFFLCALTAPALALRAPGADEGAAAAPRGWPPVPREMAGAAAVILFAASVLVLGAKGVEAVAAPWIDEKARRVAALVRDLAPRVPAGATVQVMDVTAGGIHALLRLGIREPTRFIYDFHFFHDVADPRVQALRAEFVAGLALGRPAAVVVMRETWPWPGYERLEAFPEARDLLARDYTLAVEGDGYRIYAKRSGP
jgi:hypothetical protein